MVSKRPRADARDPGADDQHVEVRRRSEHAVLDHLVPLG